MSKLSATTLVLQNPDIPCLSKQCRSRSVGFFRSQLIWICTVYHIECIFVSKTRIKLSDWLEIRKRAWHLNLFSKTRVKALEKLLQTAFYFSIIIKLIYFIFFFKDNKTWPFIADNNNIFSTKKDKKKKKKEKKKKKKKCQRAPDKVLYQLKSIDFFSFSPWK